ncbi:hypothetical protein [Candidatus Borreliella tachyglossi]|uniref:hypothetical protein n=1 Tax=Candidatus Borreliella tachyglossi TaxID=1964448 RepID=UPI001901D405|nr:hypothetical protein [Candidatus Borreliella tachyglossi]
MKGFLAIRLSSNEYFPLLKLGDISVKKVVLGKLDETNVKLDLYISEYEDFMYPFFVGSFFLDNLKVESSSMNVYFRIDSMMLYVYGECDGIENKAKFDLGLINFGVDSGEFSESLENEQLSDKPVLGTSDVDLEEVSVKELDSVLNQDKADALDVSLDNVDDLLNSSELDPVSEDSIINKDDQDMSFDSWDSDHKELVDDTLDFDSNLNLDIEFKRDYFENNVNERKQIDGKDANFNSDNNVVRFIENEDSNFSGVNVPILKDSDDLSVEDIIADIDKGLKDSSFDSDTLDFSEDFTRGVDKNRLDSNSGGSLVQTPMLYLSLVSLFLLIFFSLFLVFSKVLNPRNFKISYYYVYKEEKIKNCEDSSYV